MAVRPMSDDEQPKTEKGPEDFKELNTEALSEFCKTDPTGQLFSALLAFTQPVYYQSLEFLRDEFGLTHFAPWDILYIQRKIFEEIDTLYANIASAILGAADQAVRQLATGLGFREDHEITRVVERGQLRQLVPGVTILLEHDELKASFGSTRDVSVLFPKSGAALCTINYADSTYTDTKMLFHELGHALHFVNIWTEYPTLRESIDKVLSEGIARLFEQLAINPAFALSVLGKVVDLRRLTKLVTSRDLYTFRECLVFGIVESAAYKARASPYGIPDGLLRKTLFPNPGSEADLGPGFFKFRYENKFVFYEFSGLQIAFHYLVESHLGESARMYAGGQLFSERFAGFIRPLFRDSALGSWEEVLEKAIPRMLHISSVVARFGRGMEGSV
jgi:hypothetical protein